ncbi:hypothetical protein W97_05557 [Coniosporium apollinis CBS 100218]|uniref:Thioredoxin-like fold domain-containing protein n=1 Tax=Coniosporium apollinis (strain CBS 100218) TaxID=1168221 RepID=R7YXC9_CONA1|nr:uncharacterized protein W97_05557 [Coniosporium apollinis CBS 100218]EON66459.1 hypothetical protein W97_05557 [Coniosporium apollinis CBS 100218]
MWKKLFGESGVKNTITLFHAPSSASSTRVLTLLKQANATSAANATADQASSHETQSKTERTNFELEVTTEPPTSDQLRSIFEYLGPGKAAEVVKGANDEGSALRTVQGNASAFQRPVVVDWNQGKAVVGADESEILNLLKSIPK